MKNCNSILKFNKYIVNKVYLVNNENYKEDKNGTQVKFAIEPKVENDGQKMKITLIVDIFKDAVDKMVDHSCDEATEESMRKVILEVKGVRGIDLLQTRLFGSKMYVDIEISAEGDISLNEAHDIAENVHHTIEDNFKDVKHCMVHVNPVNE